MSDASAENIDEDERRSRLRAIHARAVDGNIAGAGEMAIAALADGIEHPLVLDLAAGRMEATGRHADSLALLLRAKALAPTAPGILNALGLALQRVDRHAEAMSEFTAALAAAPDFAPALANRAASLVELVRLREARADYEQALQLDPKLLSAQVGLAALAVRRGAPEKAIGLARSVLAAEPGYPPALLTVAEAELARGRPEHVAPALRQVLADPRALDSHRAIAESLLGDTLHVLGRFPDAIAAYQAAADRLRVIHAPVFGTRSAPQLLLDAVATAIGRARGSLPALRGRADAAPRHVFLAGFPRSGTTLLEQALEQHDAIVTMGERECLEGATQEAFGSPQAYLSILRRPDAALEPYRRAYWDRVRAEGHPPSAGLFVDKHPFHSFRLPLIARLFPEATILFAVRDPRDVVLSCFRRRFAMNDINYQFLSLAGTAALYDATLRLVTATEQTLGPRMIFLRLEDLVADFDGETHRLCAALGLQWTDALGRFAETIGERGVATPSAPQLARGLNAEGVGAWRGYEAALAPVLPKLAPWLGRFGYV